MLTVKSLAREIRKAQDLVDARFSKIEVITASSECHKKQQLKDLEQVYGTKTGWIFIIGLYKYTKIRKNTSQRRSRIQKYMSAFEAGYIRSGKGS